MLLVSRAYAIGGALPRVSAACMLACQVRLLRPSACIVAPLQLALAAADNASTCVQKDGQPGMLHIFVHVAVHAAMERNLRERELTSLLFVALVPDTIPDIAMVMGFRRLLSSCEDLILGAHHCVLFALNSWAPAVGCFGLLQRSQGEATGTRALDAFARQHTRMGSKRHICSARPCCGAAHCAHIASHSGTRARSRLVQTCRTRRTC